MKKFMCLLVLVAMIATMLVACGGSFTCGLCGKEASGKKYTKEVMGQKVEYCEDCNKGMSALDGLFG